jgi:hypothetical protein
MSNAKQRIITIKDSMVISESFNFNVDVNSSFTDPLTAFNVGDVFSAERYAILYGTDPYKELSTLETVYIIPPSSNKETIFLASGLQTNIQPYIKSKYVYVSSESDALIFEINEYSKHHDVKIPNFTLINKETVTQKYIDAGFSTLLTLPIYNRADIFSFPFEKIILKPSVSFNSGVPYNHPFKSALYIIKTKTELLNILDGLGAFSNPNILADNPVIAQQVADSDGDNFKALILSGVINGAGNAWHFAPIELSQQFNDTGRNAKTVWSAENNTTETAQLQQCIENLLAASGSVNCFYHLQFLQSNGAWVPHDFQYRMTYYVDSGLEKLGFEEYKIAAIKFAFDKSTQTPEQPKSFGLSLSAPRSRASKKQFVSGANKAEVLATLESM